MPRRLRDVTAEPGAPQTCERATELVACRFYRCKARRGKPCRGFGERGGVHTIRWNDAKRVARWQETTHA